MNETETFWLLNDLRAGCHEMDDHYTHEIGAFTSSIDKLRSRRREDDSNCADDGPDDRKV